MTDRPTLVLIVDDERDLRDLVDFNLRQAGCHTLGAAGGAQALAVVAERVPDIVLLDLNLPDISGTEVCRRLKSDPKTRGIGIIMLTARGTETDRIVGFELGADDYVVKPFSVRELVLRVEALRRRLAQPAEAAAGTGAGAPRVLRLGDVEMDLERVITRVEGVEVPLTLVEFRLLAYLIEGEGRVRTREDLLANVWKFSPEMETRTVDTHIKRLRDKLGPSGERIETVRGLGYRVR